MTGTFMRKKNVYLGAFFNQNEPKASGFCKMFHGILLILLAVLAVMDTWSGIQSMNGTTTPSNMQGNSKVFVSVLGLIIFPIPGSFA